MTAIWEMVVAFITDAFNAMTAVVTSVGTNNVLALWLIAIPLFGLIFGIVKGILHSSSGRRGGRRKGA